MKQMPQLLVLGSAGRNSGKTLLASQLVKKYKQLKYIICIKITTIKHHSNGCPRGNGCGVCGSLETPFEIVEEKNIHGNKDTSRILQAGADKVYWLKTFTEHLETAFNEFLKLTDSSALIICESNSIMHYVKPGLFLILKNSEQNSFKKSTELVKSRADRIITFNGSGFDFNTDTILCKDNAWHLTPVQNLS